MPTGTFLVTAADDGAATLRDVESGQTIALSDNPGVEAGEVIAATVEPEPPLEVAYRVVDLDERREIPVERSDLEPTQQAREIADGQSAGEVTREERAGEGEIHVLTVPDAEAAAADVLDDEETLARAARLGVDRVSVRVGDGLVSVRYLPD